VTAHPLGNKAGLDVVPERLEAQPLLEEVGLAQERDGAAHEEGGDDAERHALGVTAQGRAPKGVCARSHTYLHPCTEAPAAPTKQAADDLSMCTKLAAQAQAEQFCVRAEAELQLCVKVSLELCVRSQGGTLCEGRSGAAA